MDNPLHDALQVIRHLPELLAAVKELKQATHEFVQEARAFTQKYEAVEGRLSALIDVVEQAKS